MGAPVETVRWEGRGVEEGAAETDDRDASRERATGKRRRRAEYFIVGATGCCQVGSEPVEAGPARWVGEGMPDACLCSESTAGACAVPANAYLRGSEGDWDYRGHFQALPVLS
ncbi:hypothetical protein GUJ93_ZPchr0004g38442 [Zizania palustris]|uniref:Uncharacterized protein n=1 Tax=Zizania palustris TaxID=103762 RepID=A0A8J5VZD9_ZIZPA|nr:hypothetical protein GUJ93_ZPchr0004g38442 [Zizania palustris]